MVTASAGLVPIYVDCSAKGSNAELQQKYGVRGYPTVLFLDPEGTPIEPLGAREAPKVKEQIDKIVARFGQAAPPPRPRRPTSTEPAPPVEPSAPGGRVKVADGTLEEGLAKAKEEHKLLAVVFTEVDERKRDEHTEQVVEALRARGMDQLPERFVWIRRPVCDDIGLPTPEADAHRASKSPTVVLFDPWAEVQPGRPAPSLVTEDDLAELRAALERGTLEAARAGHPPKERPRAPATPPKPGR